MEILAKIAWIAGIAAFSLSLVTIAAFSVQYIQGYWKFVPIVITVSVLSFAAYHSHKKKQSKKKNRKKTYTTTTAAEADDEPKTTNELFLLKRIDYKTHITIISSFPK